MCVYVCVHTCRLAGSEAAGADPLFVSASQDPLACVLDLQQLSDQSLGMADTGYNPASLDVFDHALMLTDEVRSLLAVLAPWLAQQQPFLLVRRSNG